jgi:hypothetical protein
VARRFVPAGRARGGEVIQARRPARARLITALGSLAALGAAAIYTTMTGGRLGALAGIVCALGVVLLALGLVLRWPNTIPWAIALAGAGYLVAREGKSLVDGWAALVGVALLLAAELASWSIEHDSRIQAEPALVVRRVATLVALIAAALLVDFFLLAAAAVSAGSGLVLAAAGVAAAVSAVAVVLRLARS